MFIKNPFYLFLITCCFFYPFQLAFSAANQWHVDGPVAVVGTNAHNIITTDPLGGLLYAPIDTVDPNGVGDTLTFGVGCANDTTLLLSGNAFLLFGTGDEAVTTANIDGSISVVGTNRVGIRDSANGITVNIGATGSINVNGATGSRAIEVLGANGELVLNNAGTITSNTGGNTGTIFAVSNITLENTDSISTSSASSGGRAIASTTGDIHVTLNDVGASISTTGPVAEAIFAQVGSVTIDSNLGNITTTGNNGISTIAAIFGNADVTIGYNNGNITASGGNGMAIRSQSGAVTITTNDTNGVIATFGSALTSLSTISALSDIILDYNDGQISSQGSLVSTMISSLGNIVITTNDINGEISSVGGNTIAAASGDIILGYNDGEISSQANFLSALVANGNISITTNDTNGVISSNGLTIRASGGDVSLDYNNGQILAQGLFGGAAITGTNTFITTNDTDGIISSVASSAITASSDIIIGYNDGEISSQGFISSALFGGNTITITTNDTNGNILTTGDFGSAVFGENGVTIDYNDGDITTTGIESHAIRARSSGDVIIGTNDVNGNIETQGLGAKAIFSDNGNVVIGTNAGQIATTGGPSGTPVTSDAIWALLDITITDNSGNITTMGDEANALYSDQGDIEIGANSGLISTGGTFALAMYANLGSITIDLNDGVISTMGLSGSGIVASNGDVTIGTNSGSITTAGNFAVAVRAFNDVTIDTNSGTIATTGDSAAAILAGHDIIIGTNSGSSITTQGFNSEGLLATHDIIIDTNTGIIATQGDSSEVIASGNDIQIGSNSGTISTAGNGATAIFAGNALDITNECDGVIHSDGSTGSRAIFANGATNGGSSILNRGEISTASTDVPAIEFVGLTTNDTIVHESGTISSNSAYAIQMGGGDDTLTIRSTTESMAVCGPAIINGIAHGGDTNETNGDTLIFDFIGFCQDELNLGENGSITHWGITYTWEEFENVLVTGVSFRNWGITYNQRQIGDVFDCIEEIPEPELLDFIQRLVDAGESAFPGIANQLSPQRYEAFGKLALSNHDFMLRHLNNRSSLTRENATNLWDTSGLALLDNTLDPQFEQMNATLAASKAMQRRTVSKASASESDSVNDNRFGLFLTGNLIMADGDGTPDIYDYEWTSYGIVAGADYKLFPSLVLGVIGGYTHADVDLDDIGSDADVDSYMLGTYLSWWWNNFYVNGMFSYCFNEYEGTREVPFFNNSHRFDTDGHQYNLAASGGYDFRFGGLTIGPVAGVRYVNLNIDGFTEGGDGIDRLTIADDHLESFRTSLGAKTSYTFSAVFAGLTPELRAAWGHEFLDDSRGITARFNSSQLSSFTIRTTDPERDWAELGGSLRARFNQTISAFIDYDAQVGQDNFFAHAVQGGVRLEF